MYQKYHSVNRNFIYNILKLTTINEGSRKLSYNRYKKRRLLLVSDKLAFGHHGQIRHVGMLFKVIRNFAKLRYIMLGSAAGGGYQLSKKYESWKEDLPDLSWIAELIPKKFGFNNDNASKVFNNLSSALNDKWSIISDWIKEAEDNITYKGIFLLLGPDSVGSQSSPTMRLNENVVNSIKTSFQSGSTFTETEERINQLQEELMNVQLKYQKEIEKLEKENKELKKQILLRAHRGEPKRKVKSSLIDMYSELLDEFNDYCKIRNDQNNLLECLPRVIVVGDQSAGKTSVLEMIAGARIFPRGAGQMMTRAPVKVTLSEGPYHIARIKDCSREFDLTKESELGDLRREIEIRMINSVKEGGKSVSKDVISLTVQGPGISRMILVDLPGVISTVTTEMTTDTKEAIKEITQTYMSNPNSIILCIQDGSVDAERSIVTDLVSKMDPAGKRTIFVLTKVDIAEENLADPNRMKKILEGKLFPMNALGYYAVVTGKSGKDDDINSIREHEERFFKNSKLFKDGILNATQCSTRNLSFAVSNCFWKMVKASVEQQADAFRATRFNLETEWKNSFPRMRELDRDELFEKARGEILDEVVNLSLLSPTYWEELISNELWKEVGDHVFENIFLPAAHTDRSGEFDTLVDIKLKEWIDLTLPKKSVFIAFDILKSEFQKLVMKPKSRKCKEASDYGDILGGLKNSVCNEAMQRHNWEEKAADVLKVIQFHAMEDKCVPDKEHWNKAIDFLENSIIERLNETNRILKQMVGARFYQRWLTWTSQSQDQYERGYIKEELDKLLHRLIKENAQNSTLNTDDIITIKKNLNNRGIEVNEEMIKEVWNALYRINFLEKALNRTNDCRKCFYLYQQGMTNEVNCENVIFFWRIQKMLQATGNALRQQIMNREGQRLEKEIKEVLDDFSQNQDKKLTLLTGRRVLLAEELKRIRQIQEKLEEFITALNKEK